MTDPTPGIGRRGFLAGAGAAAGLALATSTPLGAATGARTRPTALLDVPAIESPIDTIVVVMQENRSFDHYLGWLGADDAYLEAGARRYGRHFGIDARTDLAYEDAQGDEVPTAPLVGASDESNPWRGCGHPVPGHGWYSGRVQIADGFLAPGSGNDAYAVGWYGRDDLPLHAQLADRFTVCDQSFSSLCAGTFPNRQYMHTAQSGGDREDPGKLRVGMYETTTIWDKLLEAQVPCGYYYTQLPVLLLWGDQYRPIMHNLDTYFEQCASGTLPNVVFVDPSFGGDLRTDEHPQGDVRVGQAWLQQVIGAFVASPQWERGAMVVTYDEWGGFFDHVRPPRLADARASADLEESFGLAGFRVPTTIVSPYASPGRVDHTVYDHTSILRMIEWRFLGAPAEGPGRLGQNWWLTTRDQYANNLARALRGDRPDPEFAPVDVTNDASPACAPGDVGPPVERAPTQDADPFHPDEDLEDLLASDYAEGAHRPWLAHR